MNIYDSNRFIFEFFDNILNNNLVYVYGIILFHFYSHLPCILNTKDFHKSKKEN